MTDETFLRLFYFGTGLLSLLLGIALLLLVRRSLFRIFEQATKPSFANLLRRFVTTGLLLAGFVGFLSVDFRACSGRSYDEIVSDRSFVVDRTQEQGSQAIHYSIVVLMFVSFVTAVLISRKERV